MKKTLDVNIVHPTHSDCHNFEKEDVTIYYHFIFKQYQVTINYTKTGYHVLVFGFVPDMSLITFDCAHWHKVETYNTLQEAVPLYLRLCKSLIEKFV